MWLFYNFKDFMLNIKEILFTLIYKALMNLYHTIGIYGIFTAL